ncbi:MAG: SpoIIE family protein phosphatase [Oscillospiraceae bacterium]|jgi:hypothetical protein|nr:SpoIIE family protein phosphatase [Oscillospiraceae bacterium]
METANTLPVRANEKPMQPARILRKAAVHALSAGAAFALAYGGSFAGISPFGLAFAAAVPFPYCVTAAAGACAGYALGAVGAAEILRFAAAVLAAVMLRVIAECFLRADIPRILYPAGAAVSALATGAAVLSVEGFTSALMLRLVCETILAGGACMLFGEVMPREALYATPNTQPSPARDWLERTRSEGRTRLALVFSAAVFIAALAPFRVLGLSPSVSLAALLILSAAFIAGAEGGSVAGVAFSAALLLRGESVTLALMLCLGGVLAGALSPLGRLLSAGVFCAAGGFLVLLNPVGDAYVLFALCIVGAAIFLCIPPKVLAEAQRSVQPMPIAEADGQAVRLLDDTSLALKQVRECVERVSLSLEELGAKHALDADAHGEEIQVRTRTLRDAVSEQLGGMEDILHDLGETLSNSGRYLPAQSAQAKATAIRAGLACRSADCTLDRRGHIELRLILSEMPGEGRLPGADFDYAAFLRKLQRAAGVDLREISLEKARGGEYEWEFAQKAAYALDVGVAQRARGDARLCGDYYAQFMLPGGETVFLLSDGMGTGGRAVVDSALTCTLFSTLAQAGLSFPCALRLTNAALMAKSAEESLATLDAAVFDPYTGELRLYKAGAAASILTAKRTAERVESDSLPAGILREIAFGEHKRSLAAGDICVLFSDGAVFEDDSPLRDLLNGWSKSAEKLAQAVLSLALRGVPANEQDDATAAVLKVESAAG